MGKYREAILEREMLRDEVLVIGEEGGGDEMSIPLNIINMVIEYQSPQNDGFVRQAYKNDLLGIKRFIERALRYENIHRKTYIRDCDEADWKETNNGQI